MAKKHVALVYYSLSHQTRRLVDSYRKGLEDSGLVVELYPLQPVSPLRVPLRNNFSLFRVMLLTFLRKRSEIQPLTFKADDYDYIVLAGPTWSYQPSGPMLSFLDHYGSLLSGKKVGFLISCRSYWRSHYWSLRYGCKKNGALPQKAVVFEHATQEPWCTIGLLVWLRGVHYSKLPKWFQNRYPYYGHSSDQIDKAYQEGVILAEEIL